MKSRLRSLHLIGALFVTTLLVGCQGADDADLPDEVEVQMSPLTLDGPITDPAAPTLPRTVCTVGGITMHCCPEWQSGRLHYVMIGVNLATNSFRCARLVNEPGGMNAQPPFLNPANTNILDQGFTFQAACTSGVMVGLHWDQKRVACVPIQAPQQLVNSVDMGQPQNGFRYCGLNFGGSTNAGKVMIGMATSNPNVLRCKH